MIYARSELFNKQRKKKKKLKKKKKKKKLARKKGVKNIKGGCECKIYVPLCVDADQHYTFNHGLYFLRYEHQGP